MVINLIRQARNAKSFVLTKSGCRNTLQFSLRWDIYDVLNWLRNSDQFWTINNPNNIELRLSRKCTKIANICNSYVLFYTNPRFQSEFILAYHLVQLWSGHSDNYKCGRGANCGANRFREINWQLARFCDPAVIIHALDDTHRLDYKYIKFSNSTHYNAIVCDVQQHNGYHITYIFGSECFPVLKHN